jgi:hypothetical protein
MATQTSLVQHGEKEVTLHAQSAGTMGMIERAVSDPNFNAENFRTLVEFRDRELARNAQDAFNAAMAAAQGEMRPIEADANNPQTRSRYATYAKLDKALRPVYNKHGFGLSFNTVDSPIADHMRVLCYVSHIAGHTRTYQIDIPTDGKGAKGNDVMTKTHAVGAGASYAMRYLLKMIFNVAVGEDDRDGNDAPPQPPRGYAEWVVDMEAVSSNGIEAFKDAWKRSSAEMRDYTLKFAPAAHKARRERAEKVVTA